MSKFITLEGRDPFSSRPRILPGMPLSALEAGSAIDVPSIPVGDALLGPLARHPLEGYAVRYFGNGIHCGVPVHRAEVASLCLYVRVAAGERIHWRAKVCFPDGEPTGWLSLQAGSQDADGAYAGLLGAGEPRATFDGLEPDAERCVVVGGWSKLANAANQINAFSLWGSAARPCVVRWAAISQA